MPFLLYCGENDEAFEPAKRSAAALPNAAFAPIPGVDHLQCMMRGDLVLPHLTAFLRAHSRRPVAARA